MPTVRHGRAGAKAGRRARTLTGSHLSGNVQAGPLRTARGPIQGGIEVIGVRGCREVVEETREPLIELIGRGHAWPPLIGSRASGFRPRTCGARSRSRGETGISRHRARCPVSRPLLAAASRGSSAGRRAPDARARVGQGTVEGVPVREEADRVLPPGTSSGLRSTSTTRRRRRRVSSIAALTIRRWSQASNRSGSRNPGRSRQARMSASWTASRASSWSRTMRRAAASMRAAAARASTPKASRSPFCARSTSVRWSTAHPLCGAAPWPRSNGMAPGSPDLFRRLRTIRFRASRGIRETRSGQGSCVLRGSTRRDDQELSPGFRSESPAGEAMTCRNFASSAVKTSPGTRYQDSSSNPGPEWT